MAKAISPNDLETRGGGGVSVGGGESENFERNRPPGKITKLPPIIAIPRITLSNDFRYRNSPSYGSRIKRILVAFPSDPTIVHRSGPETNTRSRPDGPSRPRYRIVFRIESVRPRNKRHRRKTAFVAKTNFEPTRTSIVNSPSIE